MLKLQITESNTGVEYSHVLWIFFAQDYWKNKHYICALKQIETSDFWIPSSQRVSHIDWFPCIFYKQQTLVRTWQYMSPLKCQVNP